MRKPNAWLSLVLPVVFCTVAPAMGAAADDSGGLSPLTLNLTRAVGAEAVIASGTSVSARTLEATLYVTYSRDLPTVVLSRRSIAVETSGKFSALLPTAPAYFRDAIVTVVIRSQDGLSKTATLPVRAPNLNTSLDIDPLSH